MVVDPGGERKFLRAESGKSECLRFLLNANLAAFRKVSAVVKCFHTSRCSTSVLRFFLLKRRRPRARQ